MKIYLRDIFRAANGTIYIFIESVLLLRGWKVNQREVRVKSGHWLQGVSGKGSGLC